MDKVSQMGYKDSSPFKNRKKLKIKSDKITMQGVSQPLLGISDKGESQLMLPDNNYSFKNANYVMEYPLKKGGYIDLLQNYLPTLPENQQDELIDTLDTLPEQERYDYVETMMNGGCYKCGGKMEEGGKWIQKAVKHPGRCTPGSPNYDCPKGSPQWNLAQTFKKHHGFHQEGGQTPTYPELGRGNVEVEDQETVKLNDGRLFQFKGKTHEQGGIKTELPGGSLIFSDHLKASPETVQIVLGKKTNKKYSYADLSKKFPTQKALNTLKNPKSDEFEMNTAELTLNKNQAMLETIFGAQEMEKEMKNNKKFQSGGLVTPRAARPNSGVPQPVTPLDWDFLLGLDTKQAPLDAQQNNDYLYDYPAIHTEPSPTVSTGVVLPAFIKQPFAQKESVNSFPPELQLVMPDRTKNTNLPEVTISAKKFRPRPKTVSKQVPQVQPLDSETVLPLPFDSLPQRNVGQFELPQRNPFETPTSTTTPSESLSSDDQSYPGTKKTKREFGINPKITGTLLDIGLALSDNLNVEAPILFNNKTYPIFNRFVQFDNKEPGRNLALSVQQIQNSNMPEQVKQAQIAQLTAQANEQQSQVDFGNQQRYEQKQERDTNKLQGYMDRNTLVGNQDLENYLQRKGRVESLKNQFKAQRKSRIVNSLRGLADYADDLYYQNQLNSPNYDVNFWTGRVDYTGGTPDPLKQQEQMMSQYQSNAQNSQSLPNGATVTMIAPGVGIVTSADGKAEVVKF